VIRAATIAGPEHLTLTEVALGPPASGEVMIDVAACGICGSNLHEWRSPEQRIDASAAPGATGHEVTGIVLQGGEGSPFEPGALVVVEPNLVTACGVCPACAAGAAWFCRTRRATATWGFADRMVVPARAAFPVPAGVDPAVATLVEPAACGVHAVRGSAKAQAGRIDGLSVAVIGAGVGGLLAAAAARYLGAGTVAVVARHPHQAEAAQALGADEVITDDAAADRLRLLRPQFVIEAVGGTADTLRLAAAVVAPRGEIAVLGLFDEPQVIDARRAVYRELRLWFPVTYGLQDGIHDFEVAIDMLAAGGWDHLITHRLPLDEVDVAFRTAADKRNASLRVVVTP
jgi:L-iditol 2-dehydrogenase